MKTILRKAIINLKKGELIAFPTETVYGLGADAKNNEAINKIFSIKKRPRINPLICHFYNADKVKKEVIFNKNARILVSKFWPGPLTIILKKRKNSSISNLVTNGLDTLACRVPSNKIALYLLKKFNGVIAAPSANLSSKLTSTHKKHVLKSFGKNVLIIDGGPSKYGLESTVIDLTKKNPIIVRPGAIESERIKKILPNLKTMKLNNKKIISPGQLNKHYSPNIPLRINVKRIKIGEVLLNFGKNNLKSKIKQLNLSYSADLNEAANNLFRYLHILDNKRFKGIAVAPTTNKGIGKAINDRLKRASFNE